MIFDKEEALCILLRKLGIFNETYESKLLFQEKSLIIY